MGDTSSDRSQHPTFADSTGPDTLPAPLARPREFAWVPIKSLSERHRPRILAHLLALDTTDRYLRFGYAAADDQIRRYVERIAFERDEVFGVSVALRGRGRGYGARLFDHAVLRARNRGVDTIVIHALSENAAMLKIVRNAGAAIERTGVDAEAHLRLPPENYESRRAGAIEEQLAELDYQFKQGAHQVDTLLSIGPDDEARGG